MEPEFQVLHFTKEYLSIARLVRQGSKFLEVRFTEPVVQFSSRLLISV